MAMKAGLDFHGLLTIETSDSNGVVDRRERGLYAIGMIDQVALGDLTQGADRLLERRVERIHVELDALRIRNPGRGRERRAVQERLRVQADRLAGDRKSTRLNSSHTDISRMPSSA